MYVYIGVEDGEKKNNRKKILMKDSQKKAEMLSKNNENGVIQDKS